MSTPDEHQADFPTTGDGHGNEVGELRATVQVQQVGLNRLADQVRNLTTLIHELSAPATTPTNDKQLEGATVEDAGRRPAPWCSRDMPPAQAAAVWAELADWVAWLHTRYPLAETLLPCWWRHPEVVEEVTAAHAAWKAAYTSTGASPYGPGEWHDRWLPGLEQRLTGRWKTRRCADGHQPTLPSSYGTPVDDPAALRAHISWLRDDRTPPETVDLDQVEAALTIGAAELIGTDLGDPIYHRGQYWTLTGDADAYQPVTDPDQTARLNDARRRQRLSR